MQLSPLKIGNLSIAPNLVLAPMSGITNSAFRRLIRSENGPHLGLVVTEFISIEGLTRENLKSLKMLHFHPEERPISIQIFGHDIDRMVDAAQMAEQAGADIVDINSGCPVPKVVRRGGGCDLMRQPDHLGRLLAAVREKLRVPLTLKIRAGWDEKSLNAVEIARIAEDSGVQMLAVHGRTRVQLYRGDADWSLIERVAKSVSIPVVGSGDVVDAKFAERCFTHGVSGIMIGRGALQNPWIFSDLAGGGDSPTRSASEVPRVLLKYLDLLFEEMPEKGAIGRMKQLASQITRGVEGGKPVRKNLVLCRTTDEMREILNRWSEELNQSRDSLFGYVPTDSQCSISPCQPDSPCQPGQCL